MVGDRELARDLAQEAFIRQHRKWSTISKFDKPGAWVRKVAMRLAFKSSRKRFWHQSIDEAQNVVTSEQPPEVALDVRAAVLQLPPQQRAAVVLHYYRDLPVLAVADAIGCSESTAKSHLQRARGRLAELLVAYDPRPADS